MIRNRAMIRWPLASLLILATTVLAWGSEDPADDAQEKIVARYLIILERNPRRGTALDRVYGHYVESGDLDALVERFQTRTKNDATDAAAWMMLGLIEAKRGNDADAAAAFTEAEKHDADSPLASYYLGQASLLAGKPSEAVEALERALDRNPPRVDLLEIYRMLGQIHQRAGRREESLKVWNRLAELFPDDLRVQEQIARALADGQQFEEALKRFESLAAKTADDAYRQVQFRIEAADISLRLRGKDEAIGRFEKLLGELKPDSWLHKQVRQRLENCFHREDDLAGLVAYYKRWLKDNPEDVGAMVRIARTLAIEGRSSEASAWFAKGIALAPKRADLRQALIEQFVYDRKYAQAIAQCAALDAVAPNDPDHLRRWGKLVLKDPSRPEPQRKKEASEIFKRLLAVRSDDALLVTQVAELMRQAGLPDEALELYREAIRLQPEQARYREYLGQFYQKLGRKQEAIAAWYTMAEGDRHTTENLRQLTEVLVRAGYREEATQAAGEACRLDADDFDTRMSYAELLHSGRRYTEALEQLDAATRLGADEHQRELVLDRQIKVYLATGDLFGPIEKLAAELAAGKNATADRWRRLAWLWEAANRLSEATRAVRKSLELDGESIATWQLAAQLHLASGDLAESAAAFRKLADSDPAGRTQYLTELVGLNTRLGDSEKAVETGRELLEAAPNNAEHYQFFANLCFQLGELDEGLDTLRRAVRLNPTGVEHRFTLAEALAAHFMTAEAIELYWQTLDKSNQMAEKLRTIGKLTELHLRTSQFDQLLARLQRAQRIPEQRREMTLCIAEAHIAAQDYAAARAELQGLLIENDRDADLLGQLSLLAQREGDIEAAVRFQQRLSQVAPNQKTKERLAQLYLDAGRPEDSHAVWAQLVTDEEDPLQMIDSLDNLLTLGRYETILSVTKQLLMERPDNWELLYREGLVLARLDRVSEARQRFGRILDLTVPDHESGIKASLPQRVVPATPTIAEATFAGSLPGSSSDDSLPLPRSTLIRTIRSASRLEMTVSNRYGSIQRPSNWLPVEFGEARLASIAWLVSLSYGPDQLKRLASRFEIASGDAAEDQRQLWAAYYYHAVQNNTGGARAAARQLSQADDLRARRLYLNLFHYRTKPDGSSSPPADSAEKLKRPLANAEIDHVLLCYRDVFRRRADYIDAGILRNLFDELQLAEREPELETVYREAIEAARQPKTLCTLARLAAERDDIDTIETLFDRMQSAGVRRGSPAAWLNQINRSLVAVVSHWADDSEHAKIFRLLDAYLKIPGVRYTAGTSAASSGQTGTFSAIWRNEAGRRVLRPTRTPNGIAYESVPTANAHFDPGALLLLYTAKELCRRDGNIDQLIEHFAAAAGAASQEARVTARLGLSYLHWWNGSPHSAVKELENVVATGIRSPAVLFDLATIQTSLDDSDAALKTLDMITAVDRPTTIRREWAVLRLLAKKGQNARAEAAARRLFGMQLPVAAQLELAIRMRALDMDKMADLILARVQRHKGGGSGHLLTVMNDYLSRGKTDQAVEAAVQILRRPLATQRAPSAPGFSMGMVSRSPTRDQAMRVLVSSGKLEELIEQAETQWKRSPRSAQSIRILMQFYRAIKDLGRAAPILESLAADDQLSIPSPELLAICAPLEGVSSLRASVVEIYQRAAQKDLTAGRAVYGQGLIERLVGLYAAEGRNADARDLLAAFCRGHSRSSTIRSPQQLTEWLRIAGQFRALGFPLDAFRICCEISDDSSGLRMAGLQDRQTAQLFQRLSEEVRNDLKQTPEQLLRELPKLFEQDATTVRQQAKEPVVDFLLFVGSSQVDEATVGSPIGDTLRMAASKPALFEQTRRDIAQLEAEHPDDVSVGVAVAMLELFGGTQEAKRQSVEHLVALIGAHPLPEPLAGAPATLPRHESSAHLACWLVARECLQDESLRPWGEKLAARAIEAGQRTSGRGIVMAMFRELGQAALDRSDTNTAEAHWRELLDLLVEHETAPVVLDPIDSASDVAAENRPVIKQVTTATFTECVRLSKMAMHHGMPQLSLDAIRESLRAGPPRPAPYGNQYIGRGSGPSPYRRGVLPSDVYRSGKDPMVQETITQMDQIWREYRVAPEKVYATLLHTLLATDRPDEIYVYPKRLTENSLQNTHSVGLLLVRRAVEAGHGEDLEARLELRQLHPRAEFPARALRLQLAAVLGDTQQSLELLDWLARRLKVDKKPPSARTVCHAAVGLLGQEATNEAATAAIEQAAANLGTSSGDSLATALWMTLLQGAFQCGDIDRGAQQLRTFRESNGGRVVKANSSQLRKLQVMDLAIQLARAGALDDALTVLGDFIATPNTFGRAQGPAPLIEIVLRQLADEPAERRYRLFRDWMLPGEDHAGIRRMAFFAPNSWPPAAFFEDPVDGLEPTPSPIAGRMISFSELLTEAAGKAGKLPELAEELRRVAIVEPPYSSLTGAEQLRTLIAIARGQGETVRPRLESLLAEFTPDADSPGQRVRAVRTADYLLARACLADEALNPLGVQLAEAMLARTRQTRDIPLLTHLARDLHTLRADRQGDAAADIKSGSAFDRWHPTSHQRAATNESGTAAACWSKQPNRVTHVCGPQLSFLHFDYPLTGSFEFTADGYVGETGTAAISFGGIVLEPQTPQADTSLWPVGEHDKITRPGRVSVAGQPNELTVEVRPDMVRYLCNGRVLLEDADPSPTSPWLALVARAESRTHWSNPRFTGQPEIPREVPLTYADRLEGWSSRHFDSREHYSESLPRRLSLVDSLSNPGPPPKPDTKNYEWSAWEGIIHGRRSTSPLVGGPVQSYLVYHRPMRDTESISFEFLYRPGEVMVHPAIGRVAMLLETDGVRLHWITDSRRDISAGLPADNALDLPQQRRGPKQLPLEPSTWNAAEVSIESDEAVLRLNGEEVYRHRLDPSNGRQFGLFHYSDRTAVEVRNVVLRGDWPEAFPIEESSEVTAEAMSATHAD